MSPLEWFLAAFFGAVVVFTVIRLLVPLFLKVIDALEDFWFRHQTVLAILLLATAVGGGAGLCALVWP